MRRIAGLLVATTHLGFAGHALAQSPAKGHQSAKRGSGAVSGAPLKRAESLGSSFGGKPPAPPAPVSLFTDTDADQNGRVSFGEFATLATDSLSRRIGKRFRQLDKDHDGRCTRAEVNKMSAARFARFDLDRNGYFTAPELARVLRRELTARLEQAYVRLDVDRDGRLSVAELTPPPAEVTPAPAQRKPAVSERQVEVARRQTGSTN